MSDEPTLGEVMRSLEATAKRLDELARQMAEDRRHAAETYVRQDVYVAQRQADQAVTADLSGDIRALASEQRTTEAARKANVRWAVGIALSMAGLIVAVVAVLVQGGQAA